MNQDTTQATRDHKIATIAGMRVGDLVAKKYRIERVLGIGGMGVVCAARHIELDDQFAIKFLPEKQLSEPSLVARFTREAQTAAKIKNEHVVRVFDVGRLANGVPYIVMEYLEGRDLALWLQAEGPLPIEQAAECLIQACAALGEAHRLGIIHRDLKPSNLFCVPRPHRRFCLKVLDFGISKITLPLVALGGDITAATDLVGSPSYMSPEQMRTPHQVDFRTDVWSLGVVLYEILTGQLPFPAVSLTEVCLKVANDAPEPINQHRPDIPPGLEAVVLRCLEKDRDQRYETVSELAQALAEFAPSHVQHEIERTVEQPRALGPALGDAKAQNWSSPPSGNGSTLRPATYEGSNESRGKTRRKILLGMALMGALGLAAVLRVRGPMGVSRFDFNRTSSSSPNEQASSTAWGSPQPHETAPTEALSASSLERPNERSALPSPQAYPSSLVTGVADDRPSTRYVRAAAPPQRPGVVGRTSVAVPGSSRGTRLPVPPPQLVPARMPATERTGSRTTKPTAPIATERSKNPIWGRD